MSTPSPASQRLTAVDLRRRKHGEPIVTLTAYTAPMARLLDPHVDCFIVGDSLGMVVYGDPSTLAVDLDTMIRHARAVVGASARACVVVDLPFGSYQQSPAQAFAACARVLAETGAQAVKLEGGSEMAETVRFLTERGVPVMGHIGLLPQHVNAMGGYKVQGREPQQRERILADAHAVTEAGAFALLVEGVVAPLAEEITRAAPIPTVGIGASAQCDGQVLVTEDLLGLTPRAPRFVKRYADLAMVIGEAAAAYARDVRARAFPTQEHTYAVTPVSPAKSGS